MASATAGRGWGIVRTEPTSGAANLRTAGRSAAWLARRLWEPKVASSNLAVPILVVLLAAGAALSFGALAVTIRLALGPGVDAEAASLVTTVIACVVCAALAAAKGDFSGLVWRDTWPFLVTGLFAPGITQILFTRAVGLIGPSRTAVLVGVSPVLSAAIAVTVLGEPLRLALVLGTMLVVARGTLLVQERGGTTGLLSLGFSLALGAAFLFGMRDNLVRWAARGNDVPGFVAATASLVTASLVILVVVALRPRGVARIGRAAKPFLLSGLVSGVSYVCLYSAF